MYHKQDWLLFLPKFSFTNTDQLCDHRHHNNNITTTNRTRPTWKQDNIEKISQPLSRWWWRWWWWCYKPITNNKLDLIVADFVRSVSLSAPLQVFVCRNMKTWARPGQVTQGLNWETNFSSLKRLRTTSYSSYSAVLMRRFNDWLKMTTMLENVIL